VPALRYDALAFIDGDLAMLTAKPQSWLNWDFTLARNGEFLANIDLSIWRERGGFTVADTSYRTYREGLFSGAFILEANGAVVARAYKPSAWTRRLIIEFDDVQLELKPLSALRRGFQLKSGARTIGTVVPRGFLSRGIDIDLPDDLPLPLRAFVVWLVVMLWRREANAGG
jgi:hypothetical protein